MNYNKKIKDLNLSKLQIYNTFKDKFNCSERSYYNYLNEGLRTCDPQIKEITDMFLEEYQKIIVNLNLVFQ